MPGHEDPPVAVDVVEVARIDLGRTKPPKQPTHVPPGYEVGVRRGLAARIGVVSAGDHLAGWTAASAEVGSHGRDPGVQPLPCGTGVVQHHHGDATRGKHPPNLVDRLRQRPRVMEAADRVHVVERLVGKRECRCRRLHDALRAGKAEQESRCRIMSTGPRAISTP